MAQNNRRQRNAFRKLEKMLTYVILSASVLFLLMLLFVRFHFHYL